MLLDQHTNDEAIGLVLNNVSVIRSFHTVISFKFQLIEEKFHVVEISLEKQDPVYRSEDIRLFHFVLKDRTL